MMNRTPNRRVAGWPLLFVVFCLLAAGSAYATDEAPTPPQPTRFRITGLFSPERATVLREVVKQVPEVQLLSVNYEYAEAEFAYDVAKLFQQPRPKQGFTEKQIVERLDNLLRAASNYTMGVKLPSTTPKDKLAAVQIPVFGLDCQGCCLGAYEAVAKIDGVEQATASFKEGRITALIDPEKTNRAALEEALTKARVPLKAP